MAQRKRKVVINEPAMASVREAADFLSLSSGMVRKLIKEEKWPVVRFGTAVRVPWAYLYTKARGKG